jgi:hypothetical protein
MARRRPIDYSRFTALPGGESIFHIEQDASPELKALADEYPDYLKRALRHLAFRVLGSAKAAIRAGGPAGTRWPERSKMHQYRRLESFFAGRDTRLKQKTNSGKIQLSPTAGMRARRKGQSPHGERAAYRYWSRGDRLVDRGQSIPDAFTRWKAPAGRLRGVTAMSGLILGNIAFGPRTNALQYSIGALTPKTAKALAEVQAGRKQRITPKMRRAFWAAGVPVARGKSVIDQPPRPLLDPLFKQMRPYFEGILIDRIKGYIEGGSRRV